MSVQRYSCAGFGDSTDFGIYTFPGASPEESEYFKLVTAESKTELLGYIDEFEQVIDSLRDGDEGADLVNNYRFSRDDIDESDYLYITDRDGEAIGEGASIQSTTATMSTSSIRRRQRCIISAIIYNGKNN